MREASDIKTSLPKREVRTGLPTFLLLLNYCSTGGEESQALFQKNLANRANYDMMAAKESTRMGIFIKRVEKRSLKHKMLHIKNSGIPEKLHGFDTREANCLLQLFLLLIKW